MVTDDCVGAHQAHILCTLHLSPHLRKEETALGVKGAQS